MPRPRPGFRRRGVHDALACMDGMDGMAWRPSAVPLSSLQTTPTIRPILCALYPVPPSSSQQSAHQSAHQPITSPPPSENTSMVKVLRDVCSLPDLSLSLLPRVSLEASEPAQTVRTHTHTHTPCKSLRPPGARLSTNSRRPPLGCRSVKTPHGAPGASTRWHVPETGPSASNPAGQG